MSSLVTVLAVGAVQASSSDAAPPADQGGTRPAATYSGELVPLATTTSIEAEAGSATVRGRLVFNASTDDEGYEPWTSDGTARGTRLLADLLPGTKGSYPSEFVTFREQVYFLATGPSGGTGLWRTDGDRVVLVYEWDGGAGRLVSTRTQLFLVANTPQHGVELWASDGSRGGTREVRDIWPGQEDAVLESTLVSAGEVVLFRATHRAGVLKPWVSDGTEAGTRRLDLYPDEVDLHVGDIGVIGDRVVLAAGDDRSGQELWGGLASTGVDGVSDLRLGEAWSGPRSFTRLADTWVFSAVTAVGRELWITDGTAGGTGLLRDIVPGSVSGAPQLLTPVGHRTVLFIAADEDGAFGLWSTTGTTATTRPVDLPENVEYAYPVGTLGRRAVVVAWTPDDRPELLVSEGGTAPLRPVAHRKTELAPDAELEWIGSVGNVGFVSVENPDSGGYTLAAWNAVSSRTRVPRRLECHVGDQVRVPVRVTSAEGAPSGGAVSVLRSGRTLGRARLIDGAASVRLSARLAPGLHRLRARWTGSLQAASSTSGPLLLRIDRAGARSCR